MRILAGFVFATTVTLAASAAEAPAPPALTVEGYGPVKVGMTLAQAEKALGVKLNMYWSEEGDPKSCGTGVRADKRNGDVYYMLEGGHVVRVEVVTPDTGTTTKPPIRTAKGIRLGSTEAEVKRAYPGVKVEPHPYLGPAGHTIAVKSADGKTGIIFDTDGKTVIEMRAGVYPQVGYIEGCA